MTRKTRDDKKPRKVNISVSEAAKPDDNLYLIVAPHPEQFVLNLGFEKYRLDNTSIKVNGDSISCGSKNVFDLYDKNPWDVYKACITFPRKNKNSVISFPVAAILPYGKAKFYYTREQVMQPTMQDVFNSGHVALVDKQYGPPNEDILEDFIDAINVDYEFVPEPN